MWQEPVQQTAIPPSRTSGLCAVATGICCTGVSASAARAVRCAARCRTGQAGGRAAVCSWSALAVRQVVVAVGHGALRVRSMPVTEFAVAVLLVVLAWLWSLAGEPFPMLLCIAQCFLSMTLHELLCFWACIDGLCGCCMPCFGACVSCEDPAGHFCQNTTYETRR